MLTYMSLPDDSQALRAAKLKALQKAFKETDATAFAMLAADALSPTNRSRGTQLVINSHGNANVFAGYTPEQFLTQLKSKGFSKGSFAAIQLMACKVGVQQQDNSVIKNFARDFVRLLVNEGIDVKVYAPRGTLTYDYVEKQASGQTYYEITRIYIKTVEREYPLDEGMLLIKLA